MSHCLPTAQRKRSGPASIIAALAIGVALLTPTSVHAATPTPYPGCTLDADAVNHCTVAAEQTVSRAVHGVGADIYEDIPLAFHHGYSIAQITLERDTLHYSDDIEFGWIEDPLTWQNSAPHLFIAIRRNSSLCILGDRPMDQVFASSSCPDPFGWFQSFSSASHHIGDQVGPSGAELYHVGYFAGDKSWWVQYGNEWIGEISNSWWGRDNFTNGHWINTQGEVAFNSGADSCVPMGNGDFASNAASSYFSGMYYEYYDSSGNSLIKNASAKANWPSNEPLFKQNWTMGRTTKYGTGIDGFHFGGPGGCPVQ